MPESATFSNRVPSAQPLNTKRTHFYVFALAALAACCCVHATARAQKMGPQPATEIVERGASQQQGEAAMRERRAAAKPKSGNGATAQETATKNDTAQTVQAKDATEAKDVKARKETGASSDDASEAAGDATMTMTKVDAETSGAGVVVSPESELEALRAKFKDAKPGAEHASAGRAYVERLVALDRKPEAVAELRAMVEEERFDPPYFYNAGNSLARLGESNAAVEAYRKAISQRHGNYARAEHNLGVVLVRLGRWDEAQEALTVALRQENFTYAEASYNLGRLHALRGEAGLAINEWTRTLRLQPDHANAATGLARALAEDGDTESALAVLDAFTARANKKGASLPREIAVTRGEIVAAANVAAVAEHGRGGASSSSASVGASDYREARSTSTSLHSLAVDRPTYDLLQRARAAREAGRNEDAATLFRRVMQNSGGYFPPANLELAYSLGALDRLDEAVAALLPITRKDAARYPIAFFHLGRYYEHLGQLNLAGDAFARAAASYGETNPQFLLDVSRIREKEGRTADALAALEEYMRLSAQQGSVPEWAHERVAKLREKMSAAKTTAQ